MPACDRLRLNRLLTMACQVEQEAQWQGLAFVCSVKVTMVGYGPRAIEISPVFRSVLKRCDAEFAICPGRYWRS